MSASPRHRLCLASPVFYPTYGGAQLRFMSYLPGLRERNLDVRVYKLLFELFYKDNM